MHVGSKFGGFEPPVVRRDTPLDVPCLHVKRPQLPIAGLEDGWQGSLLEYRRIHLQERDALKSEHAVEESHDHGHHHRSHAHVDGAHHAHDGDHHHAEVRCLALDSPANLGAKVHRLRTL